MRIDSRLRPAVSAAADDQRDEQCDHRRPGDLVLVVGHRGGGQRLADEEGGQPAAALFHHLPARDVEVRRFQRFGAAELLHLAGGAALGEFEDVVGGDDAEHASVGVDDGQGDAVVTFELRDDLAGGHRDRDRNERAVLDVGDRHVFVGEDERPESEVLQQFAVRRDNVEDVKCLLAAAGPANLCQRVPRGHVRREGDVARRHVTPGGAGGIAQQVARRLQLLGRQRLEQPARDLGGQLVEQAGAVVRRHAGDDRVRRLARERLDQPLLVLDRQVREHRRRPVSRQHAKDEPFLVSGQVDDDLGDVGGSSSTSASRRSLKFRSRTSSARSAWRR
jgi:hypothetical protein